MTNLKDTSLADMLGVIANRRKSALDLAETLARHWDYDLFERRPGPALLDNGVLKPTDLDLACFLSALVDRRAVINLPVYKARRGKTVKKDEHVISEANRHGNIVGLTSNKNVFSFGVRVVDQNVMKTDEDDNQTVGAYRNFLVVDLNGTWYDGWRVIEFVPTAKENSWLNDKKLWTGNRIVFQNFVHPNRWTSFYGKYYLASKAMIERLEDEGQALRALIKKIKEPEPPQQVADRAERGPTRSIVVQSFEAVIETPGLKSKYRKPMTVKGAKQRLDSIRPVLSALRFATRATELAFHQHGPDTLPSWMQGQEWVDFRKPRARTIWQRIEIPNTKNVALMFRVRDRTEQVAL